MPERRVNDIEGWVGYRNRFFGVPQRKYLKLSGSTITVHPTPTGVIESYISVVGSTVATSLLGRVLTLQMQSGYKYYLHFQTRFQCQEWAALIKSESTRRFNMYYDIGEQIGEGAFASVHKGTRKSDGDVVAIKKVVKQQFDMVTYRELQREIYTMQNLQHVGIVKTYDVFNTPTEAYFVLEFMQGGSLKDLVRKNGGRISEAAAIMISKQVLLALVYLHENRYAHRDIKLENILCETEDLESTRVCLADFGYTNFFEDPGDECMRSLIGTPVYVAPEIFREKPYSEAVDMYAAGVMIFRMLCGEYPYDGGEDNEKTKDLAIRGRLDFRQSAWKEISSDAKSLVRGLLQPSPWKRLSAQGAVQHSWFTNQHASGAVNTSRSEEMRLPGTTIESSQRPRHAGESETTIISRVAAVDLSHEKPPDPRSHMVQDLIARFRSVEDPNTAQEITDAQHGAHPTLLNERLRSPLARDPDNDHNNSTAAHHSYFGPLSKVDDVKEINDSPQSRPRYTSEQLRKKLKRYMLAAVFSSKLLLVSELKRPRRRKRYQQTIAEGPRMPDRRKVQSESNESTSGRNYRPSLPNLRFRTFSFSGRMSASGTTFSPIARLTSRLKRTFSLGRDRR
eukprot:TRINITY_DN4155_c0_g1_i1.p1 TRINITY_DN4155_c0_g1~~TRINITY_DN4155_c0_g1_i1.p1  ORF type:complete len:621 (-),score=63.46 TRINITY_DN4155_c0_g1_i1:475-2337(-)